MPRAIQIDGANRLANHDEDASHSRLPRLFIEYQREMLVPDALAHRPPDSHQIRYVGDGIELLHILRTDVAQTILVKTPRGQFGVIADIGKLPGGTGMRLVQIMLPISRSISSPYRHFPRARHNKSC